MGSRGVRALGGAGGILRRAGSLVPSNARVKVALFGCLMVLGAAVGARLRAERRRLGAEAPAAVDEFAPGTRSTTARAQTCARELRTLLERHPATTARAVHVETGRGPAAAPVPEATVLEYVDGELAAAASALRALERAGNAPARADDLGARAGELAARSHRASDRLCTTRDMAWAAVPLR